jgi:hypothetical protein
VVVRRLTLLAVLALCLAACGGSGASGPINMRFGTEGGTLVPVYYEIARNGDLATTDSPHAGAITSREVSKLSGLVRAAFPGLKSEQCPGSFPDESSMYITALGRTVTVRGTCDSAFTKLYNELNVGMHVSG